jgi:predicted PurR-regulated permease PerM
VVNRTGRDGDSDPPADVSSARSLILWTIWMTALAVVLLWSAYLVRDVLLLIYVSGLLAIGFSPIVRLIERQQLLPSGARRAPRWLAILVLYLFILGTIAGIGSAVLPPIVRQAQQLWQQLPAMYDRAQDYLIARGLLTEHLTLKQAVQRAPVKGSGEAVGTVLAAVVGVAGGLFGVLTTLILTFYVLVEADRLRDTMLRLFPASKRARAAVASRDITVKVSAWLGGQLLLGAIIGGSSAIGLWLLGIPFFYVLALISGIGELIPVVGPILSAVPAIAVAATVSVKKVLLVILFFVVQQQVENHLLVPKIMSRQVGVSAVTVIVALLVGGKLLGILGAILAVPTAAILQVVFVELTATGAEAAGPDTRPKPRAVKP